MGRGRKKSGRFVFVRSLAPKSPPAGSVVVFYNTKTGAMNVKKADGTVVSLEQ